MRQYGKIHSNKAKAQNPLYISPSYKPQKEILPTPKSQYIILLR